MSCVFAKWVLLPWPNVVTDRRDKIVNAKAAFRIFVSPISSTRIQLNLSQSRRRACPRFTGTTDQLSKLVQPSKKWIAASLFPNSGVRAVAAHYFELVAERHNLFIYRGDEPIVVSAGQIGSADVSVEEAVAGKDGLFVMRREHYMPNRVAGAMADLEFQLADLKHLAVIYEPGRLWRIFVLHSQRRELMRLHSHKQRLLRQGC